MTKFIILIINILIHFIWIKNKPAIAEIDYINIRTQNYDTLLQNCYGNLRNNKAVLLYIHKDSKKSKKHTYENKITQIILGNQNSGIKAIKQYNPTSASGSSSNTIPELQFHHVIFKNMRESLPGIRYVCFQTPISHHKEYHSNLKTLKIKFNDFTTINNYLSKIKEHTSKASENRKDEYSFICQTAARIGMDIQQLYINEKYPWLNLTSGSKYLMIAHRVIAPNSFPNTILINRDLCNKHQRDIERERNLYSYITSKIENDDNLNTNARHIRKILETKIKALDLYTREEKRITITRNDAIEIADKNHGKCTRTYKVRLNIDNLVENDSDTESTASSLIE